MAVIAASDMHFCCILYLKITLQVVVISKIIIIIIIMLRFVKYHTQSYRGAKIISQLICMILITYLRHRCHFKVDKISTRKDCPVTFGQMYL